MYFILNRGQVGGTDASRGMTTEACPIEYVTILDDCPGLVLLDEGDHSTMGARLNVGPVMGVGTNDDVTVLDLQMDAIRVLNGLLHMGQVAVRALKRGIDCSSEFLFQPLSTPVNSAVIAP